MRKLILVLGLAVALTVLFGGIASADAGPHGGYTSTTSACAGCHRAHTGQVDDLLKAGNTQTEFCFTCHGNGGLGAATNAQNGTWMDPVAVQDPYGTGAAFAGNVVGRGLKGGGFDTAIMDTNLDGTAASASTTSKHHTDAGDVIMWGGAGVNTGKGPAVPLKCASCHDPHGKASSTKTPTYRILRGQPSLGYGTIPGDVPDIVTKTYTIDSSSGKYYTQKYANMDKLNLFCAYCHNRIHAASAAASGDQLYRYRHVTTGTNVDQPHNIGGFPACLTCHVAHGSTAAMEGYATQVTVEGVTIDSALLRIDNRGVCEACHQK